MAKPKRVRAKIEVSATQMAVVVLDRDGNVEEVEETMDYDDIEVKTIISVLSVHP